MTSHEEHVTHLLTAILGNYPLLCAPFPYEDCHRLFRKADEHNAFICDLDLYWAGIAGYCSRGLRLVSYSKSDLRKVRAALVLDFWFLHPQWNSIKGETDPETTPRLYSRLELFEETRQLLANLLISLEARALDTE